MDGDEFMKAGKWRGDIQGFDSYELAGKTVGIVGLGNIGKKVARRLKPFEVTLLYADPIADPELERELGMTRAPLAELLPQVEVLTLHVPLLASTRRMIGRAELDQLKPSAVLINTCRGGVVDEPALLEALTANRLRGAALDVFEQEPLPSDSPFLKLRNVVLGAHSAGQTFESYYRRAEFAFENMEGIWQEKPAMAVIDPAVEL